MEVDCAERQAILEEAQEVLRRMAQYTEPTSMVQRVCDHPAQIIGLQTEILDLTSRQFLPPSVRSYRNRDLDTDSDSRARRRQEEARGTRNGRGTPTGTGGHDPACTAIWTGSPRFEDAVSECIDVGG